MIANQSSFYGFVVEVASKINVDLYSSQQDANAALRPKLTIKYEGQTEILGKTAIENRKILVKGKNNSFRIYIPSTGYQLISLYDLKGREVFTLTTDFNPRWYDIQLQSSPGIHLLTISKQRRSSVKKLWLLQ